MKPNNFTIVTGLWNLGRDNIEEFSRSFDHYLETFENLLRLDFNFYIYVPKELDFFVYKKREKYNTEIVFKEREDFRKFFPYFDDVQKIRTDPAWYNQVEWLKNSPQAKLEYYNPILMSKFLLVNEAAKHNPFNTDYFFWLDAGICNTCGIEDLQNMSRLPDYMEENFNRFLFLSYPYETETEVHGFEHKKFYEFCDTEKTNYVCRGGFFGGKKDQIEVFTQRQQIYAGETLQEGYMGADECIHTILSYRYEKEVHRYMLESDGLVYRFFQDLRNTGTKNLVKNLNIIPYNRRKDVKDIKTSMYVLTYNSPKQFEKLMESYEEVDPDFLTTPRKILIDNSTNYETYDEYQIICKRYGFEHIKKEENLGICGGRQLVAEHFNESDSEYYIFLEDDMNLNTNKEGTCSSGHNVYIKNLYEKSLSIIHKEEYDFLKLSYSEFYGTNDVQWAWYNVPQRIRDYFFPDKPNLPREGLTEEPPKLIPTNRKRHKDLHYLEGEYYYCNWPLWFSRKGNAKMFLETKWSYPNEQTWMSYCFQEQKRNRIKSAILELSPIFHHRFDFYPAEERKES